MPPITILIIAWSTIVFVGINATKTQDWADVVKWGYFSTEAIHNGAWYGLITSAFVHIDPIHFFFNMYWLWILGGAIEREVGPIRMLLFCLSAALVSSGWQLATGDAGIGFSGVGYAIVGFGWIARQYVPSLKNYFTDQTVTLFGGWGVLCIVLTFFKVWNIGNVAHIMGFAFGLLLAFASYKASWPARIGLAAVTILAIVPVFYNPFSPALAFSKAAKAQDQQRWLEAIALYRRSIELGDDGSAAWQNIAEIYGYLRMDKEYKDALEHLKPLDAKAAAEVIKDYGEPK